MRPKTEKKIYFSPEINRVIIDNQISLVLISGDPGDPGYPGDLDGDVGLLAPEFLKNKPFKINMV